YGSSLRGMPLSRVETFIGIPFWGTSPPSPPLKGRGATTELLLLHAGGGEPVWPSPPQHVVLSSCALPVSADRKAASMMSMTWRACSAVTGDGLFWPTQSTSCITSS